MRFLEQFKAKPEEIRELLDLPVLALVAASHVEGPDVGLFPFLDCEGHLEVHMERSDAQLAAVEEAGRGTVVVGESLSTIPSWWADSDDVLLADAFHRTLVVRGRAEVVRERGAIWRHLEALLGKYQADGPSLDPAVPRYTNAAERLALVRVRKEEIRSKFKLGQQYPEVVRRRVLEGLRRRGTELDMRTATLVAASLSGDATGSVRRRCPPPGQ